MSAHPGTRNLLGPYVMGALEPWEEREVEHHLQSCAGCREEARKLRLAHERLADLAHATETPPQDLKGRVVARMPHRPERRVPAWMAAVFCVLAVLGVIFIPDIAGSRALASATLTPTELAPDAGGEVDIQEAGRNTQVHLQAWGLPPCERGQYYELWLVKGKERVSAGSFTVGPSGRVEVNLNAPDFAASYPTVGVTGENDKDHRASHSRMLSGELRKF